MKIISNIINRWFKKRILKAFSSMSEVYIYTEKYRGITVLCNKLTNKYCTLGKYYNSFEEVKDKINRYLDEGESTDCVLQ